MPTTQEYQELRERFFDLVYPPNQEGFVCIAKGKTDGTFEQRFFEWPDGKQAMLTFIERNKTGHNLWYCPHLLGAPVRRKAHATVPCQVVWADLDECDPHVVEPPPSIIVESSPGRYQGLWRVSPAISPDMAEVYSQRIAYKYADQGADPTGWDLSQLLRVPYTYNYKPQYRQDDGTWPLIDVLSGSAEAYSKEDLDTLPVAPADRSKNGHVKAMLMRPERSDLPPGDELIEKYTRQFPSPGIVWRLFNQPVEKGERSSAVWRLAMECIEAGMSRDEVYAVCYDSAVNKFRIDNRTPQDLWNMVVKAFETNQKHGSDLDTSATFPAFYRPEEMEGVGRTILDDYVDWAKAQTDAAHEYHLATGLMILSTLLAAHIRIPVSYRAEGIVPNLWVMILAPSTVTRKSTAMGMGKAIIEKIDPSLIVATDATLEGLFQAMANRPGKTGLFYRDEITGLMGAAARKDYMKGIIEGLIQMYDNQNIARQLSQREVKVTNPIMPMFSGGIKDKLYAMLEEESISSGFMPRMIIVSADISKLKRQDLGPPTEKTNDTRGEIIRQFKARYDHYRTPVKVKVGESEHTMSKVYKADFTPDAWKRINEFDALMTETAKKMRNDLAGTMLLRMTEKCMKIATLLAAVRQKPEGIYVKVHRHDIVQALSYLQEWLPYTTEAIEHIGHSGAGKNVNRVHKLVIKYPQGIARSQVMNEIPSIGHRQMGEIIDTLVARGLVDIHKGGRSPIIIPRRPQEG